MRLIDIDAFRKEQRMAEHCEDCERNPRECQYNDFSMMDFCGWLDDAPIVDAVPVKHGRWEPVKNLEGMFSCSLCGDEWGSAAKMVPMRYCPSCGAKMDLEEQDANNI